MSDLYTPSGDPGVDRLAFFHLLERLKTQKRTGWINNHVPDPESISDHMYRMSVLALCSSDPDLDVSKCTMMCIVHDIAEAQVGDIAPSHGIAKEEKIRLETEAMRNIVHDMLHNSSAAQRIEALWQEYEAGETAEAKFVKDLDRIEMALQASEYEKRHDKDLQAFFDSSLPKIRHPEVRDWAEDLERERTAKSISSVDET
ncbi:hypothetical protein BS47DRAFT_1185728 [Hydnum rufescens UP504]|uniref:5'-deoxynucleotidase n=1 Tax=Hydnum rufescens UP504 TaxID=1448309 RepID=A0A9P6DQS0_9AGAM|nr:hypothetical protein BS47DRAFT_1185728 [Hydnum rufescens UP504]